MAKFRGERDAFGRSGMEPRWTHGNKDGVGTAYGTYHITNSDPQGRDSIVKDLRTDPQLPCLRQRTRIEGDEQSLSSLRCYAICAPHLQFGGWSNNGYVLEVAGRSILAAEKAEKPGLGDGTEPTRPS